MENRQQNFNSGLCTVYALQDSGGYTTLYRNLRFGERVIGIKRYYAAAAARDRVVRLVRIPPVPGVCGHCVVVIGTQQYQVELAQIIPDSLPRSLELTLKELERPAIEEAAEWASK